MIRFYAISPVSGRIEYRIHLIKFVKTSISSSFSFMASFNAISSMPSTKRSFVELSQ